MSGKGGSSRRRVTVDSSDEIRTSVFARLGPGGAANQQRQQEYPPTQAPCRHWMKYGSCDYYPKCVFSHPTRSEEPYQIDDLRAKVPRDRQPTQEFSDSDSDSPKRFEPRVLPKVKDDKLKSTIILKGGGADSSSDEAPVPRSAAPADEDLDFDTELKLMQKRQLLQRQLSLLEAEEEGPENIKIQKTAQDSMSGDSDQEMMPSVGHHKKRKKNKDRMSVVSDDMMSPPSKKKKKEKKKKKNKGRSRSPSPAEAVEKLLKEKKRDKKKLKALEKAAAKRAAALAHKSPSPLSPVSSRSSSPMESPLHVRPLGSPIFDEHIPPPPPRHSKKDRHLMSPGTSIERKRAVSPLLKSPSKKSKKLLSPPIQDSRYSRSPEPLRLKTKKISPKAEKAGKRSVSPLRLKGKRSKSPDMKGHRSRKESRTKRLVSSPSLSSDRSRSRSRSRSVSVDTSPERFLGRRGSPSPPPVKMKKQKKEKPRSQEREFVKKRKRSPSSDERQVRSKDKQRERSRQQSPVSDRGETRKSKKHVSPEIRVISSRAKGKSWSLEDDKREEREKEEKKEREMREREVLEREKERERVKKASPRREERRRSPERSRSVASKDRDRERERVKKKKVPTATLR